MLTCDGHDHCVQLRGRDREREVHRCFSIRGNDHGLRAWGVADPARRDGVGPGRHPGDPILSAIASEGRQARPGDGNQRRRDALPRPGIRHAPRDRPALADVRSLPHQRHLAGR